MSSTPVPEDNSSDETLRYMITDIVVGVAVITIVIVAYLIRLMYKKKKKKRKRYFEDSVEISMIEMELDPPPKKTAADHLEEIKGVTQKIFEPLKRTSFENPRILSPLKERPSFSSNSSHKTDKKKVEQKERPSFTSTRSSSSSNKADKKKVEQKERPFSSARSSKLKDNYRRSSRRRSKYGSRYSFKAGSRAGSLPPPPPPSPLGHRNDDSTEKEPIQMPLLNMLLSKNLSESSSESSSVPLINSPPRTSSKSKVSSSRVSSRVQPPRAHSRTSVLSEQTSLRSSSLSHISSGLPSLRDRLNTNISGQISGQTPVHFILNKEIYKEKKTNDYTNFQPIQNIKPIQNTQSFNKVKTVVEEDEEVIL